MTQESARSFKAFRSQSELLQRVEEMERVVEKERRQVFMNPNMLGRSNTKERKTKLQLIVLVPHPPRLRWYRNTAKPLVLTHSLPEKDYRKRRREGGDCKRSVSGLRIRLVRTALCGITFLIVS